LLSPHLSRIVAGENALAPLELLELELLSDCLAIVRALPSLGLAVPAAVLRALAQSSTGDTLLAVGDSLPTLVAAHRGLVRLVAPATPRAAQLISRASRARSAWWLLGPFPLMRSLLLVAIACLLLLLVLSLVGAGSVGWTSDVRALLAAAAGAGVGTLQLANRDLERRRFDPERPSIYVPWGVLAAAIAGGAACLARRWGGVAEAATLGDHVPVFLGGFLLACLAGMRRVVMRARRLLTVEAQPRESTKGLGASPEELIRSLVAIQRQIADNADIEQVKEQLRALVDGIDATFGRPEVVGGGGRGPARPKAGA